MLMPKFDREEDLLLDSTYLCLYDKMSQLTDTSVLPFAGHIQVVPIFMYQ